MKNGRNNIEEARRDPCERERKRDSIQKSGNESGWSRTLAVPLQSENPAQSGTLLSAHGLKN